MRLFTLKKRSQFVRLTKAGESLHFRSFVLQFLSDKRIKDQDHPYRFGLTASKKVGNAVRRNRCKRRLRALLFSKLALIKNTLLFPTDIVLVAKKGTFDLPFETLEKDLMSALTAIGERHAKSRGTA
jgi:ribonuclease P protein component